MIVFMVRSESKRSPLTLRQCHNLVHVYPNFTQMTLNMFTTTLNVDIFIN